MPACFTLTRIGESAPSDLTRVDEEICRYLGDPVDGVRWCRYWYDIIGFGLATGCTPEKMTVALHDSPRLAPVYEFIRTHYETNAWSQR